MRPIIRLLPLILLLGMAGSAWSQDTTTPDDSGTARAIYRCTLPEGVRRYTSKPIPGAECAVVTLAPVATEPPSLNPAPGWTYLTSSAVADTYIQLNSINRNNGVVGVWVMESYKEPQRNNHTNAPFRSAIRRLSVECVDRKVTAQKTTFTAEPLGWGEYVGEWRALFPYGDFATPGSIDDAVAAYVCRSK